jgi:hypothetical protein
VGDLGGSILTGIDGNPLAVLCTQLRIPQHSIDSQNVKLYMPDGRESDPVLDPLVRSPFWNGVPDATVHLFTTSMGHLKGSR